MKKHSVLKVLGVTAALVACACIGLVGCGGNGGSSNDAAEMTLVEDGKLTIGTDFDYPPFTMMEEGQPAGFEYYMMQEICDRIGLEIAYTSPQNFDTLLTQVDSGATMDVAVSGITIDDERLELVDFSDSYYDSNLAIVSLTESNLTRDDLAGKVVGGQSGTSGEAWAQENLQDSTYKPYNTITDALTALRAGQIVAIVYDEPVAQSHVAGEYTDCSIIETIATGEQYGIAVNKSNTALTEAINKALAEMKADGTMDKLIADHLA